MDKHYSLFCLEISISNSIDTWRCPVFIHDKLFCCHLKIWPKKLECCLADSFAGRLVTPILLSQRVEQPILQKVE